MVGGGHWKRLLAALCEALLLYGCFHAARPRPLPPPQPARVGSSAVGVASWYGPGFDGKRTADGEIYDQEQLTAASLILPLGTHVLVTNLSNGRTVEVRINDRGPYVKKREIDLSHRAATILGMLKPGTARVRVTVLGAGAAQSLPAAGYFVQVGSFSDAANALRLRRRLSRHYPDVRIDELSAGRRHYYRVRMGAFADHASALQRAEQTVRMGVPVIIVRQ